MLGGAARCRNHSAAGGMHRDRRRRVGAQGTIPVAESSISVVRLLKPAATRADTGGLGVGFSFHRCPGAMFHVKQHTRRRSHGVSGGRGTTLALDSDVIARHAQRGCQILGLPCQPGFANAMTLACVRPLRSTGSLLCVGTGEVGVSILDDERTGWTHDQRRFVLMRETRARSHERSGPARVGTARCCSSPARSVESAEGPRCASAFGVTSKPTMESGRRTVEAELALGG